MGGTCTWGTRVELPFVLRVCAGGNVPKRYEGRYGRSNRNNRTYYRSNMQALDKGVGGDLQQNRAKMIRQIPGDAHRPAERAACYINYLGRYTRR